MVMTYVINDLKVEEIIGTFYKKRLQKANQKEFILKNQSKEKPINYMVIFKDKWT